MNPRFAIHKILAVLLTLTATLWAGTRQPGYPVPHVQGPTVPQSVAPGGPDFTLTVYGANFIPGSIVNWNRQPRATTYISAHELQATILSSDIAAPTAGMITVTTDSPAGPLTSSTYFQVEVHEPETTMGSTLEYTYPACSSFPGGVADLNNDNSLDIVGIQGSWHFSNIVGSLTNSGTGMFFQGPTLTNKQYPGAYQGVFGDFDGNGYQDFLYVVGQSRQLTPLHLGISLNNGDGTFTLEPKTLGSFSFYPEESPAIPYFVVGDFNQDGALDVVTWGGGSYEAARIFLGNGDATFAPPTTTYLGAGTGGFLVGDFNGDGKLDILGAAQNSRSPSEWRFVLLAGNGDGTFEPPMTVGTFPFPQNGSFFLPSYYINDFNKDGKLDIAFATQFGTIGIMLGNGDGTFRPAVYYTVGYQSYFTFAVGDFNSDGNTDILVQQYGNDTLLSILLGNGDGTFQPSQALMPSGLITEVPFVTADFNNDGLLDLSFPQYDDNIYLQQ